MKYIIAAEKAVRSLGIIPTSNLVIDGMIVMNENELRYRFQGIALEDLVAKIDGIIVSHVGAMDFVMKRKTMSQLKNID